MLLYCPNCTSSQVKEISVNLNMQDIKDLILILYIYETELLNALTMFRHSSIFVIVSDLTFFQTALLCVKVYMLHFSSKG